MSEVATFSCDGLSFEATGNYSEYADFEYARSRLADQPRLSGANLDADSRLRYFAGNDPANAIA
jgi:hypothetical protein